MQAVKQKRLVFLQTLGTDQHRQFILNTDTLLIGDPKFKIGKRVLIREE